MNENFLPVDMRMIIGYRYSAGLAGCSFLRQISANLSRSDMVMAPSVLFFILALVSLSVNWYMWRRRRRRKRASSVTKHYLEHKEAARDLIHARLEHWNQFYGYQWNRVAIRNQRTCWGSCSELGNLNFSYRILFLPSHIQDYIIVHELCHLAELNHSANFWALVAATIPEHLTHRRELRTIERGGVARLMTAAKVVES